LRDKYFFWRIYSYNLIFLVFLEWLSIFNWSKAHHSFCLRFFDRYWWKSWRIISWSRWSLCCLFSLRAIWGPISLILAKEYLYFYITLSEYWAFIQKAHSWYIKSHCKCQESGLYFAICQHRQKSFMRDAWKLLKTTKSNNLKSSHGSVKKVSHTGSAWYRDETV